MTPSSSAESSANRSPYDAAGSRTRELSIGYNIAVAIFGGFAAFIATFLVRVSGNNHAPAFYVIAAAIVTLVILLRTRETAFAPLR